MSTIAFLGLDLGTSSLKALLLDGSGRTIAVASAGYPLDAPHPGWSETDAHAWWTAAVTATRQAHEAAGRPAVAGIGLCGHMHGHVLVDATLEPLRPAILWSDGRAESARAVFDSLRPEQRRRLANPFITGAAAATLPWLASTSRRCTRPRAGRSSPRTGCARGWWRVRPVTDASDASATLLWDVPADRWADDVIADLGVRRELLPPVQASVSVAGRLSQEGAAALGIDAGVPVAVGAADAAAATVGTGLIHPGRVQLTVGTGAQVLTLLTSPIVDVTGRTHLYRGAIDGIWYAMAAVQNSGLALDWVRRTLGLDWSTLFAAARSGAPLEDDPVFIPNVTRERPFQPYPGPGAAFVGAGLHHDSADLSRAALEGVLLGIRMAVEALPVSASTDPMLLAGGASMVPGYRQMLADILGRDLEVVDVEAASARGAALIAGVAAGHWASVADGAAMVASGSITSTHLDVHDAYATRYARFQDVARRIG